MSETIRVPLTGTNVIPQDEAGASAPQSTPGFKDGVYQPPEGRHANSLHRVRGLGRAYAPQAEATEPVWETNQYSGAQELKFRPPQAEAPPPQPTALETAQAQLNEVQNVVGMLMQNQFGGGDNNQAGGDLQAPNPLDYDLWDEQGQAAWNQANNAHIARLAAQRVNEALAPHREAMKLAQHGRDLQALQMEHGDNPQFNAIVKQAVELMVADPELSLPQAFEKANDPKNARLGQKGNAHLPKRILPNGKEKPLSLGEIIAHNQMSGRAAPIRKRGRQW